MTKPILCLDFDGVLHSYTSGWTGADVVADPPVAGAMNFLCNASAHFDLAILSSRSSAEGGIAAMRHSIRTWMTAYLMGDETAADGVLRKIAFPTEKPPAFLTIDDRALTFDGTWPSIESLKAFQPWNKRSRPQTAPDANALIRRALERIVREIDLCGVAGLIEHPSFTSALREARDRLDGIPF